MKKTKFTEEQILFALKQGEAGQLIADVCRQMGISEATYYLWKKRYPSMGILEVRELRQLRDENARLKRLVADLTLDRHVLQEVIKKRSSNAPTQGYRTMDTGLLSAQHTTLLCTELPAQRHLVLPVTGRDSSVLRQRMRELAAARPRFGYERLHILLTREGVARQSG
jgi:putative transposase